MTRNSLIGLLAAAMLGALHVTAATAGGTLRIGMTASDIPLTTGQTDQGGEGKRFMGYTVYDSLVDWDLTSADKPSVLIPGLATSWTIDPADHTKWTFKLREGVKFHDGSDVQRRRRGLEPRQAAEEDAPQFDPRQAAQGRSRIPAVASYKAIDPLTVEIITKGPDATLPYQLAWIMIPPRPTGRSRARAGIRSRRSPPAPAPGSSSSFVPRERAELVPNKDYWDKTRIPKLDKMVLVPLPEANARVAALQVRPGRLDRGAGARRRRRAQGRRLQHRHQRLSA